MTRNSRICGHLAPPSTKKNVGKSIEIWTWSKTTFFKGTYLLPKNKVILPYQLVFSTQQALFVADGFNFQAGKWKRHVETLVFPGLSVRW